MWQEQGGKRGTAECVTDGVTTFRRLLSSIAGQIHTNMDTICFRVFEKETKCC